MGYLVKISKFLSLILRHAPETIELELDENGWANIEALLKKANAHGTPISQKLLHEVVIMNEKQRFSLSPDGQSIRANQGHSIDVDLQLNAVEPPARLYHGTATRFLASIRKGGLKKMSRQHVHLSQSKEQALQVGARHGKPMILEIDCPAMIRKDYTFYQSANGVWLTETVPINFIKGL